MTRGPAERARALLGVRFRPNGRDPATGLDCAGVVGAAHDIAVDAGFAMRGGTAAGIARRIAAHGFVNIAAPESGDIVLMRTGPAQFHLGIRVDGGIVHADARIGRVVETPGAPSWPVIACWRRAG